MDQDWDDEIDPHGDDDLEDDCLHEEYDLDWGMGLASCSRCDHQWYLTEEEYTRHCQWQADYDREIGGGGFQLRRFLNMPAVFWGMIRESFQRRRAPAELDEIPF